MKQSRGHTVYAGGDDVLALVPVSEAIACTQEIGQAFTDAFRGGIDSGGDGQKFTLSAGIAITHHLEPLQISVQRAHEAEHLAKKKRSDAANQTPAGSSNAGPDTNEGWICMALHTRGGSPVSVALPWSKSAAFIEWRDAFRAGLSHGFPYELRNLANEMAGAVKQDGGAALKEKNAIRLEAERILERKKKSEDAENKTNLPKIPESVKDPASLQEFASLLLVARFLNNARRREEKA